MARSRSRFLLASVLLMAALLASSCVRVQTPDGAAGALPPFPADDSRDRGVDDGPSPRQGQDVGQCLAAGVVEMHGDAPERDPVSGRFGHAAGGERRSRPDGVAERDFLAAEGERGHPLGEIDPS
jgi:hypothetical protein